MKYVPGDVVTISAIIENDGSQANSFIVKVYNGTGDDKDKLWHEQEINEVPAYGSVEISFERELELGVQYLHYVVDSENTIDESNESDNIAVRKIVVEDTISEEVPETGQVVIKTTKPVETSAQSSEDPQVGANDQASAFTGTTGTKHGIGKYLNFTAQGEFDEATIRLYYNEDVLDVPEETLKMHVWDEEDKEWDILDMTGVNTQDNYVWGITNHNSIYTAIGENLPDLEVNVEMSRTQIVEGGKILLRTTVKNTGTEPVSNYKFKAYGINNGENVDEIDSQGYNGLDAGESEIIIIEYDTSEKQGYNDILVIVDEEDEHRELEESNNYVSLTLNVTPSSEEEYGIITEFTSGEEVETLAYMSAGEKTLEIEIPGGSEIFYADMQVQAGTQIRDDPLNYTIERPYRAGMIDSYDMAEGWYGAREHALELIDDCKKGRCLVYTTTDKGIPSIYKKFDEPIDSLVEKDSGYLVFWLWLDDASMMINWENQIELGSAGKQDTDELTLWHWNEKVELKDGWNLVRIPLSEFTETGSPDLSRINWFRIYWKNQPGLIVKIDDVHFESNEYIDLPDQKPLGRHREEIVLDQDTCIEKTYTPHEGNANIISVKTGGEVCSEQTKCVNYEIQDGNKVNMQVCRGGAGSGSCKAYGCGINTVFDIKYELTGMAIPADWVNGVWNYDGCHERTMETRVTKKQVGEHIRDDRTYFSFNLKDLEKTRIRKAILDVGIREIETQGIRKNKIKTIPDKRCGTCSTGYDFCTEENYEDVGEYWYDEDILVDITEEVNRKDNLIFMIEGLDLESGSVYYKRPSIRLEYYEKLGDPRIQLGEDQIWQANLIYGNEAYTMPGLKNMLDVVIEDDCSNGNCVIPVKLKTGSAGNLTVSNLTIIYRKEEVFEQSSPKSCDDRSFCEDCMYKPYASGQDCAWIAPTGKCVDNNAYALADGESKYTGCAGIAAQTTTTTTTTTTTLLAIGCEQRMNCTECLTQSFKNGQECFWSGYGMASIGVTRIDAFYDYRCIDLNNPPESMQDMTKEEILGLGEGFEAPHQCPEPLPKTCNIWETCNECIQEYYQDNPCVWIRTQEYTGCGTRMKDSGITTICNNPMQGCMIVDVGASIHSETCTIDDDQDGYPQDNDCNDHDVDVNPGASETCNQIDDDCDGSIDEGLSYDEDTDGYTSKTSCQGTKNDCNDNNFNIKPGMEEFCGNGIDEDCDGIDLPCPTTTTTTTTTIPRYDKLCKNQLTETGFTKALKQCGG